MKVVGGAPLPTVFHFLRNARYVGDMNRTGEDRGQVLCIWVGGG